MNIPEEAVDAAAEFLFIDYSVTPYYRKQLRAALESASPHILAAQRSIIVTHLEERGGDYDLQYSESIRRLADCLMGGAA